LKAVIAFVFQLRPRRHVDRDERASPLHHDVKFRFARGSRKTGET
jgi:hypothetical protein